MPSLREDQQPDAVIDLRHGSLQRAQTDDDVLVDDGLPALPPAPVFAHEPVVLDAPGSTRKKRRVAELEDIAAENARAALEARTIALEQRRHLEAATAAWRSTAADLADLRRDLKGFAAARADLIATERARAEQAARTHVEAELQHQEVARIELEAEIGRLRGMLTEQQTSNADATQHLRDEQRRRADAEKEAKRAIAAYETAERRLETASEALHRRAADEQARIEAAEAARAAAEAELEALGGGGQVAKLRSRVEDLVQQLGELDAELAATEARADRAETAAAAAAAELDVARADAARADAGAKQVGEQLDEVLCERDDLRVEAARLEVAGEQWETRAVEAGARAEARIAELEAALGVARGEADDAKDRATVARVRLDEIVDERDALLATIEHLELAADERERRADDDLERTDTTDLEAELVAARFDAEALRGETTALAAQLEEAWAQVEDARRIAASAREARTGEPASGGEERAPSVDAASTDTSESLLDAFAELAAPPEVATELLDDEVERPADREVRMAPPPPDPEDPDARRAALGFLNSLARDVAGSRPHGH